jgi:hypothetical protein
MGRLAEDLGSKSLTALLAEFDTKMEALFVDPSTGTHELSEEQSARAESEYQAAQKELRSRFRQLLGE